MALTNAERVGKGMDALKSGLRPYVERELEAALGKYWITEVTANWRNEPRWTDDDDQPHLDVAALLLLMWEQWNTVFGKTLGHAERSIISELRTWRNKHAHQEHFSTDDAYRALDSAERLLKAISAPEALEVEKQKQELLRIRFEEAARKETRKAANTSVEGQPLGGLKAWREIVTPHPDVASGRYQQAEFAADLGQVHRGEGGDEYRDPIEFYRRTYLTEGLKMLLVGALRRLGGTGGDPVVELQTNFGGGKTHSMLALLHLFSGVRAQDLSGIEPVLEEADVKQPPAARRAVLVGTDLSLSQTHVMPDGVQANTMWGVMAWQLLGKEGYSLVESADKAGVSPGSAVLRDLFTKASPCLILIDEWVVFVRQLYGKDKTSLPAGSFEANLSFAQALTEAAKAVPGTLLVASIPSSDIEVGGEGGKETLSRLKNTFGRVESAWRPASSEEGFEIVRRRLFQNITDPQKFKERDAVVHAFIEMYRANSADFPLGCGEADYERRMRAAYPIHPELFDRLYQDWGSLDKFQRTRGVLRLMAAVIHELWEQNDGSLLILPATVPISANSVRCELTRYMDDPWNPVIEKDVDGENALPKQIDRENPNLGRYSACRRVARTLYLGSAPTLHTSNKGLEDRHIKLGCVQAGESIPTFGDALRRLTDQATHLYIDGRRYWYSTQPSVTRMALERAQRRTEDEVLEEIKRRLREEQKDARQRGDFHAVFVAPVSSGEIPDREAREARLVILAPEHPHIRGASNSKARTTSAQYLEQRDTGNRIHRNTLVFLAPDQTRLDELKDATRQYLAWKSIETEKETLNLDAFQSNQAKSKREQTDDMVRQRIPETYHWLLVPGQPDTSNGITWEEIRLQGTEGLAVRASRKLRSDGVLATEYAGVTLRHELDKLLWREHNHLSILQLLDYYAQYLYLQRIKDSRVLLDAIQNGLNLTTWQHDTFAYADHFDEPTGRYQGLKAGCLITLGADGRGLLVKPDVAARQMEADKPAPVTTKDTLTHRGDKPSAGTTSVEQDRQGNIFSFDDAPEAVTPASPPQIRRFHGSITLDPLRMSSLARTIHQEVIQHLAGLTHANAQITLEISVEVPDGIPDKVVRDVTENCRTLKFQSHGFEED